MEVVGCFVVCAGEILLLLRQDFKPQGNTWGIPSGKVEFWETNLEAIQRELKEETGINIPEREFLFQNTFEVTHQSPINYHVFLVNLEKKPEVIIDPTSHKDFLWLMPKETLERKDLIQDLERCVREIFFKT